MRNHRMLDLLHGCLSFVRYCPNTTCFTHAMQSPTYIGAEDGLCFIQFLVLTIGTKSYAARIREQPHKHSSVPPRRLISVRRGQTFRMGSLLR